MHKDDTNTYLHRDNKHFCICWTFLNWMFKWMQKQFNLPFSLPLSLWAQFTFLLTCRYRSSPDYIESIFTLLSHKKSTYYFLVWFVIYGPGKQQLAHRVSQSRGWGLEPGGEGDFAGLSCQGPTVDRIFFL